MMQCEWWMVDGGCWTLAAGMGEAGIWMCYGALAELMLDDASCMVDDGRMHDKSVVARSATA